MGQCEDEHPKQQKNQFVEIILYQGHARISATLYVVFY